MERNQSHNAGSMRKLHLNKTGKSETNHKVIGLDQISEYFQKQPEFLKAILTPLAAHSRD